MKSTHQIRRCQQEMKHARQYQNWYDAANWLDQLEGKDEWKADPISPHYHYELIKEQLKKLKNCRQQGNVELLIYHLREGLHPNLGNLNNPLLYGHCHAGTKHLIDEYTQEVVSILHYLCDTLFESFGFAEKFRFFKQAGQTFGRSALLLSGGATFGIFHMGVVKALWEQGLVPRVISGSSAGSILSGVLGTHSDAEISQLLESPQDHSFPAWKPLMLEEALNQRSLMDSRQLELMIRHHVGELTLEEAFLKTGRILNIAISPLGKNHTPLLVNYLTFPHVLCWSAALASCAVPFLFSPVTLTAKSETGRLIPYMDSIRWIDGTLTNDLPMERLGELYNVTHCIVSQTNPHVLPFLSENQPRSGWTAWGRRFLHSELHHRTQQIIDFVEQTPHPGLVTYLVQEINGIMGQRYYGDITVFPKVSLLQYAKVLANPSVADMESFILAGERATWPKMAMIRNQTKISQTLERCIRTLKQQRQRREVDSQ